MASNKKPEFFTEEELLKIDFRQIHKKFLNSLTKSFLEKLHNKLPPETTITYGVQSSDEFLSSDTLYFQVKKSVTLTIYSGEIKKIGISLSYTPGDLGDYYSPKDRRKNNLRLLFSDKVLGTISTWVVDGELDGYGKKHFSRHVWKDEA